MLFIPAMKISPIFTEFFESEKTGGLILIGCTGLSLFLSNSGFGEPYLSFWHRHLDLSFLNIHLDYSLIHWINDGLMTLFFLLVGLEIEREIYDGELAEWRNALLPIFAAIGGMIVPALLHLSLNIGRSSQSGLGIPMATDIAFALGVLSLLGKRIPSSLKIFLAALAIIDDLGAVVIIALFYTRTLSLFHFGLVIIIFSFLILLNRLKVNRQIVYLIPGLVMWYAMLKSGIHPTTGGIALAFAIPFHKDKRLCPSFRLQHFLHTPVSFLVLPVFALANTGVVLGSNWYLSLTGNNSAGILLGLILGKPLGIILFSLLAVKTGLARLPDDLAFRHLIGAGFLAGIGFTMSIFITNLAFTDPDLITHSKIAILLASTIAGPLGYIWLYATSKTTPSPSDG